MFLNDKFSYLKISFGRHEASIVRVKVGTEKKEVLKTRLHILFTRDGRVMVVTPPEGSKPLKVSTENSLNTKILTYQEFIEELEPLIISIKEEDVPEILPTDFYKILTSEINKFNRPTYH